MNTFDFDTTPNPPKRLKLSVKYFLSILSIVLGLLCLGGFIFISIYWNINSNLERNCQEKPNMALCFIRSIISNARRTQWDRFVLSSLLLTYASVFFHTIIETSRTNVSGLLGQMILHTVSIIFGIGVSFPILFLPSYLHFYQIKHQTTKSPVPIDVIFLGFIYTIVIILIPTYLISFLSSEELLLSIMSIVLLISPLAFALISLPFRLISGGIQRCWIVNSHRLILQCQIILFSLSSPLFFVTFVALIEHWSIDVFKQSYVMKTSDVINPVALIWSIDYLSLLLGLGLFISINEYLFNNHDHHIERSQSRKIQRILVYVIFIMIFIIAPCLAFPLYVAWKEYQYLKRT